MHRIIFNTRVFIAILLILAGVVCCFAQDDMFGMPEVATGSMPMPTFNKVIQMQASDTIDLMAECPTGFANGSAEIVGDVLINGTLTTMCSWTNTSTVKAVAIGSATITLRTN